MEGIPKGMYTLYYYMGKDFTYKKYLNQKTPGNFKEAIGVDSFSQKIKIRPFKQDSFEFSIPEERRKSIDTALLKSLFKAN